MRHTHSVLTIFTACAQVFERDFRNMRFPFQMEQADYPRSAPILALIVERITAIDNVEIERDTPWYTEVLTSPRVLLYPHRRISSRLADDGMGKAVQLDRLFCRGALCRGCETQV